MDYTPSESGDAPDWELSDAVLLPPKKQSDVLKIGAILDRRYEILGHLGAGGMGAVFRAKDLQSEREVAVKLALAASSALGLKRIRREGELAATLNHPGIVSVHSAGEVKGVPYLVYELVPGARELGEVMPSLDLRERIEVLRDVANAVGHAHGRGVVHRDIKPSNVLVADNGRVRLADFGLATAAGVEKLTLTGGTLGTPTHMAPELVRTGEGRRGQGPHTDVWSLGVILYAALTDELPFKGDSLVNVMVSILEHPPAAPRTRRRDVPKQLEAICLKALAKDPADRFQDGNQFAQELDDYLDNGGSRLSRPRAGTILGTLLLVALGIGAGSWAVARRLEPGTESEPAHQSVTSVEPAATPETAQEALKELRRIPRSAHGLLLRELQRWATKYPDHLTPEFHTMIRDVRMRTSLRPVWRRTARNADALRIAPSVHGSGTILTLNNQTDRFSLWALNAHLDLAPTPSPGPAWNGLATTWRTGRDFVVLADVKGVVSRFSPTTVDTKRRTLASYPGEVPPGALALTETQGLLAVAFGSTIRLLSLQTGLEESTFDCGQNVVNLAFSPNGSRLGILSTVTGRWGSHFRVWDVASQEPTGIREYATRAYRLAAAPDGSEWVAISQTGTLFAFDGVSGRPTWTVNLAEDKHSDRMTLVEVAYHPSGLLLVLTRSSLITVHTKTRTVEGEHFSRDDDLRFAGIALTPDGSHVALSTRGGPRAGLELWVTPLPASKSGR